MPEDDSCSFCTNICRDVQLLELCVQMQPAGSQVTEFSVLTIADTPTCYFRLLDQKKTYPKKCRAEGILVEFAAIGELQLQCKE